MTQLSAFRTDATTAPPSSRTSQDTSAPSMAAVASYHAFGPELNHADLLKFLQPGLLLLSALALRSTRRDFELQRATLCSRTQR